MIEQWETRTTTLDEGMCPKGWEPFAITCDAIWLRRNYAAPCVPYARQDADPREVHIRALAALMLSGPLPADVAEYLINREYGLALAELSDVVAGHTPPQGQLCTSRT